MAHRQKEKAQTAGNQGFTLIEVIAVLIVLGVLGVVIVSQMSSTSMFSVKSQADALKGHIRYAQTMAVGTGVIWGINISHSKQYSLFRDNDVTKIVVLPGADTNPIVLDSNGPSLSTGIIRFGDKGRPVDSAGNAITTTPAATITVSMAGTPSETILVTRNTGFIP